MPHVHEVMLSDGTVVTSGLDQAVAEKEPTEGELRAPQLKRAPRAPELAKIESDEAAHAKAAIAAQDFDALPDYAKTIFRRMSQSAERWLRSSGAEAPDAMRKALAAGWRAVRQKYGLEGWKEGEIEACAEDMARREGIPLDEAAERCGAVVADQPKRKSLLAGTPAGRRGNAWLVRITEERDADVKYERTEQLPVPAWPGAFVTIGIGPPNHRNILNVLVPDRLVSAGHGMAGASKWVRNNWDTLWKVGKGHVGTIVTAQKRRLAQPAAARAVAFKRFRGQDLDGSRKYVEDPRQAVRRIAYAENYVPWEVDLQGEYATEAEVEAMAHGFLKNLRNVEIKDRSRGPGEMHSRWSMPDGSPAGYVVESFVARRTDPDFAPGSWVTGIEFHPAVWQKILSGEYVGTSIGGRWATKPIYREAA